MIRATAGAAQQAAASAPADLVLRNGRIVTVDDDAPEARRSPRAAAASSRSARDADIKR